MKYVLLLVLMMAFVNPSEAREPASEIKVIATVMGQIEKANSKTLTDVVACGYQLTKGHAYTTWGPSVTFFVQTASGEVKKLYNMNNGTRSFEPIQTLNVTTADKDYYLNAKFFQKPAAYRTEYQNKEYAPTKMLSLDRVFRTYDRFKSSFETEIKRINFVGLKQSLGGLLGSDQTDDISCVF